MERTVILLREKRGVSVREQRIACNAYANEHGIKVVKEYVSTGNEPIDFQTRLRQDPLTDIVKGLIRSKIDSSLFISHPILAAKKWKRRLLSTGLRNTAINFIAQRVFDEAHRAYTK